MLEVCQKLQCCIRILGSRTNANYHLKKFERPMTHFNKSIEGHHLSIVMIVLI